jgi:hypothetical protein
MRFNTAQSFVLCFGFAVLANVIHVTAAGVSATWYFAPGTPHATSGAFKR